MTIYLVTSGNYSDYCVDAVFDSKELAEKFVATFGSAKYDEIRIEEYPLNPFEKQIKAGLKGFVVGMTKDGTAKRITPTFPDEYFTCSHSIYKDLMNIQCFARSANHAVKIANEKRTQLIATNQWKDTH